MLLSLGAPPSAAWYLWLEQARCTVPGSFLQTAGFVVVRGCRLANISISNPDTSHHLSQPPVIAVFCLFRLLLVLPFLSFFLSAPSSGPSPTLLRSLWPVPDPFGFVPRRTGLLTNSYCFCLDATSNNFGDLGLIVTVAGCYHTSHSSSESYPDPPPRRSPRPIAVRGSLPASLGCLVPLVPAVEGSPIAHLR